MTMPQGFLPGYPPLFTVREAEGLNNSRGLQMQDQGSQGETKSILLKGCCAWGMASGSLRCNPYWAFSPFTRAYGTCWLGGGDFSRLGEIVFGVFTTAMQRAFMDSLYAGFQSGLTDAEIEKISPTIMARARAYFPVRGGDMTYTKQVSVFPPFFVNWKTERAGKVWFAEQYAGGGHMLFASLGYLFGRIGMLLGDTGYGGNPLFSRARPALATLKSIYPTVDKPMILDGLPWSPSDAITKEIAEAMWNPVIKQKQVAAAQAAALAAAQKEQKAKLAAQQKVLADQEAAFAAQQAAAQANTQNPSSTITGGLNAGGSGAGSGAKADTGASGTGTRFNLGLIVMLALAGILLIRR